MANLFRILPRHYPQFLPVLRFQLTTRAPMLEDLHRRLSGVGIECLAWADLIPREDGEGGLISLDPSYWGCENDYGTAMFARMAAVLTRDWRQ